MISNTKERPIQVYTLFGIGEENTDRFDSTQRDLLNINCYTPNWLKHIVMAKPKKKKQKKLAKITCNDYYILWS